MPSSQTPHTADGEKSGPGAVKQTTSSVKHFIVLALLAVVVIFAVINTQKVDVDWVFGTVQTPLIVVIAVTLLIGLVVGYGSAKYRGRGAST
jgi:uncharacterized integral membrane protein